MKQKLRSLPDLGVSEPCPLLRRFATYIIASSQGAPILDIASGSGRNAIFLAQRGCKVICVDKDLAALRQLVNENSSNLLAKNLQLFEMDLALDPWPFGVGTAGGIINVHFLLPSLFPLFESTLLKGACLLLETVPAHGGNYLALPRAGEVGSAFQRAFDLEFYRERKAGPNYCDAVTAQLVAKRR